MIPLRLIIIADDPLTRAGLATALLTHENCTVVAQMNSQDYLEDVQFDGFDEEVEAVDLVVWDLGWDFDGSPPEWQEVETPILTLLPDGVKTAVLWASGVAATLPRHAKAAQIIAAAQAIMAGLAVFDPKTTPIQPRNILPETEMSAETLTAREIEVLQRLAQGLTNKAIAQELTISPHTIKFHVNTIMNKLNAQNRTAAVVKATRLGFISL